MITTTMDRWHVENNFFQISEAMKSEDQPKSEVEIYGHYQTYSLGEEGVAQVGWYPQ